MTIEQFVEDLRKTYETDGHGGAGAGMFHIDNLVEQWESACKKTDDQCVNMFWANYVWGELPKYDSETNKYQPGQVDIHMKKTAFDRDTRLLAA